MYKDFFGLDIMPFNTTPDASFFFASEQHKEALARLKYAIEERKGFILITGEIGSGKTTVCHTLLSQLDRHVKTALITNTRLTSKELLKEICTEFDIDCKNHSRLELVHKLNDFLIDQLAQDNNAVIIVDEAQNLTPKILEEIRLISNLETDKEKLVQIILMGQPELSDKLELPSLKQLKQRIVTRFHIYPLSKEESRAYILHRLTIAGAKGLRIFQPDAIDSVIAHSSGIPRLINIICDQALLQAYSIGKQKVTAKIIQEVVEEFIPPNELPSSKNGIDRETEQEKKIYTGQDDQQEQQFNAQNKGFWSKLFTFGRKKREAEQDFEVDMEGVVIEFEGLDFYKIDKFNKRFGRYLLSKPKQNRVIVKEDCFDQFQHEMEKEGIFIEVPD